MTSINISIHISNPNPNNNKNVKFHPNYFFDKIFIINLDKCPDRWNRINSELIKKGIFNIERQPGIYLPRREASTFLSSKLYQNLEAYGGKFKFDNDYLLNCVGTNMAHFQIVKKSVSRGYRRILILEDDVFLTSDFFRNMVTTAPYLLNNKWDLLYLGYKKSQPNMNYQNINQLLIKPKNFIRGAYGYALNSSIFPIILKYHLYGGTEIDVFFEFVLCKHAQVIAFKKQIISHRDGLPSNITSRNWKRRDY